MRCSKCLSHMETRRGKTVCAGCGAVADFRHDDGSRAVFASGGKGNGGSGILAWITLGMFALLGAGGIVFARQQFPDYFAPATSATAYSADLTVTHRTTIAGAFSTGLREALIATLGTEADDEVLAAAILPDGRIGILLAPNPEDGSAPARLVRLTGTSDLLVSPPLRPGASVAGGLQARGTGETVMALTGQGETWVNATGPDGATRWSRNFVSNASGGSRVLLGQGDEQTIVLMQGEQDDQLSLVALGPSGDLRWQRVLSTAPAEESSLLGVDPNGDISIAFMPAGTGTPPSARLLRMSAAGQDVWQADIALAPGSALAGRGLSGLVTLPDGGTGILYGGRLPRLAHYSGSGEADWVRDVPASLLNDSLFLVAGPDGRLNVVSAFRLSDVVTDLAVTQFSSGGDIIRQASFDLPAGALVEAVVPQGNGAFLVFGSVAASKPEDRDVFALSLAITETGAAPIAAEPAMPLEAGPGDDAEPVMAPDVSAFQPETGRGQGGMPAPLNGASAPPVTRPVSPAPAGAIQPKTEPELVTSAHECRFVCRDGADSFVLWDTLSEETYSLQTRVAEAHVRLCTKSGGVPDADTLPACN